MTVIRDEPTLPVNKKIGRVESRKLVSAARTDSFSSDSSDSGDDEYSIKIDINGEHNFDSVINPRDDLVPQKNGIHKFEEPLNERWVESAMSIASSEKTSDSHDSVLKEDRKPEEILIRWDEVENNKHGNDVTASNGHHDNYPEKHDNEIENKSESENDSKPSENRPEWTSITYGFKENGNDIFLPLDEDAATVFNNSRFAFSQPSIEVDSPTTCSNGSILVEEELLVAVKRTRTVESNLEDIESPSSASSVKDDNDDNQTDIVIPMRIEEDLTLIEPKETEAEDDPELGEID